MDLLTPHLGFLSAEKPGGAPYNRIVSECEFHHGYVTHCRIRDFVLPQPRVNKAMSYMPLGYIEVVKRQRPLPASPAEEESKLLGNPTIPAINHYILCPWYTIEFKSAQAHAGLMQATIQAARKGTAACEYMYHLFTRAGTIPTAVDTMHWTLICDTMVVEPFVVWRQQIGNDPVRYHMRREWLTTLEGSSPDEEVNPFVVELRSRLRNILEYVNGPTLTRSKR